VAAVAAGAAGGAMAGAGALSGVTDTAREMATSDACGVQGKGVEESKGDGGKRVELTPTPSVLHISGP
jgi:hypothetical protein